uniref:Uncharacterized protein n=1 Tax=Sus scrofa TaxID=9823 RepID=A0A8D1E9H3_PIG
MGTTSRAALVLAYLAVASVVPEGVFSLEGPILSLPGPSLVIAGQLQATPFLVAMG